MRKFGEVTIKGAMRQDPVPRRELVAKLAALVAARRPPHPVRVAIDGPDAAGKTTLATELAQTLMDKRQTILASVDDFHMPSEVRYQRGHHSPEGYYLDAFDYDAVVTSVLGPLGPRGSRRYRTAAFDYRTDAVRLVPARHAAPDAVLLFEGVFLQRPALHDFWDLVIFVDVDPDEAVRRALTRDLGLFGTPAAVRDRYRLRYLPAQQIYRAEAAPTTRADVVVDNNDPSRPRLLKWPADGGLRPTQ